MMMIRPNTPEPLVFRARTSVGEPATGLTVTVKVFNPSNGQIWDWATSAFSATPTQATATMTEVDASDLPGYYYRSWPGAEAGYYLAEYSPTAGETADDYPDPTELRVADFAAATDVPTAGAVATAVDAAVTSSHGAGSYTTATGFAVAGDAMALTSGERTTLQGLVWSAAARTLTSVEGLGLATQASVDSLPAAVWATVTGNADWTYGACVELARKHITNRLEVTASGGGTEVLYDDDDTTAIVTQTLRDGSGGSITTSTGSPALRGAAA